MRVIWGLLMARMWTIRGERAANLARKCKEKSASWTAWIELYRGPYS